ncbi:MAG TPA: sigma-70 family RNA polymerase sigma factor [Candidatus Angelobacter sp.]|jgi:RNA polymerase sigma-70 factor (ECF subfamily)
MSNRPSERVLQELNLLASLDSVKARVDTSAIAEIQDWSEAVVGRFYGAVVDMALPTANHPSESSTMASQLIAANVADPASIGHTGLGYAQAGTPQLIAGCLSMDKIAWEEFVRRYRPLIARVIFRSVHRIGNTSPALVEDLVQDVFLKLLNNNFYILKNFETEQGPALSGFLKIVATNVADGYCRTVMADARGAWTSEEQFLKNPGTELNSHLEAVDSSSTTEREILIEEINRQLQTYSQDPNFERDRKIFWLYYREGLSAQAISSLPGLGLTKKGIESILFGMTQKIRQRLASPEPEQRKKKT